MKRLVVYTDGACVPTNPGYGAWAAVVLEEGAEPRYLSAGYAFTTSNRMEIMGILRVMESLETSHALHLISDSMYVVNSVNKWLSQWEIKSWPGKIKNQDLWRSVAFHRQRHVLTAEWVKGHNGNKWNEVCDGIANGLAAQRPPEMDWAFMRSRETGKRKDVVCR